MQNKPLGILKYVIGTTLIAIGVMGGLESLKTIWSMIGNSTIGFGHIAYQLLWLIGNAALFLLGIIYFQQATILTKSYHQEKDALSYNKSQLRSNILILLTLVISLIILFMSYLSAKELVDFLTRSRMIF